MCQLALGLANQIALLRQAKTLLTTMAYRPIYISPYTSAPDRAETDAHIVAYADIARMSHPAVARTPRRLGKL